MELQALRDRKTELMEALKEASINVERIRGALWFCDELIGKMEGNGVDVTEVPDETRADGE